MNGNIKIRNIFSISKIFICFMIINLIKSQGIIFPFDITEITYTIEGFIADHSNITDNYECLEGLRNISQDTLEDMYFNSGKGPSELGLINGCIKDNHRYNLLLYSISPNNNEGEEKKKKILKFLNQNDYYIGICITEKCTSFLEEFLNKTENKPFYEYMEKEYGISNISIYRVDSFENNKYSIKEKNEEKSSGIRISRYITLITFFLISLQIVLSFITPFFFTEIQSKKMDDELKRESFDVDKDRISNLNIGPYNRTPKKDNKPFKRVLQDDASSDIDNLIFKQYNKSSGDSDTKKHRSKLNKFIHILFKYYSFFPNIQILSMKKNRFYNEEGLYVTCIIKVILIFLLSLSETFKIALYLHPLDLSDEVLIGNIKFFLVKFSNFALVGYLNLDGFLLGYKLMNFLKKKQFERGKNNVSYMNFIHFFFLSLNRLAMFFFFLLCFNTFGLKAVFSQKSVLIQFFHEKIFSKYNQYKIFKVLIPFYSFYITYTDEIDNIFLSQSRYLVLLINEFYSYIIIMIIIYLTYKIKSKIFEIIIFSLSVLSIITAYPFGEYIIGLFKDPK
ncbi:MAG: hypothetical protein MJ252_16320, partial [archaeon]|nr:hypothetical protein [archaeon]